MSTLNFKYLGKNWRMDWKDWPVLSLTEMAKKRHPDGINWLHRINAGGDSGELAIAQGLEEVWNTANAPFLSASMDALWRINVSGEWKKICVLNVLYCCCEGDKAAEACCKLAGVFRDALTSHLIAESLFRLTKAGRFRHGYNLANNITRATSPRKDRFTVRHGPQTVTRRWRELTALLAHWDQADEELGTNKSWSSLHEWMQRRKVFIRGYESLDPLAKYKKKKPSDTTAGFQRFCFYYGLTLQGVIHKI